MKRAAALVALALFSLVSSAPADADELTDAVEKGTMAGLAGLPHTWLLIGIDTGMGPAYFTRDTAKDADIRTRNDGRVPAFETQAACEAALRHAISKYSGKGHAQGDFGSFLCTDLATWQRRGAP
jgi:hypothetical protein